MSFGDVATGGSCSCSCCAAAPDCEAPVDRGALADGVSSVRDGAPSTGGRLLGTATGAEVVIAGGEEPDEHENTVF